MATTNWSKVDRLPLELRVGVATRLMDRIGYDGIREWLRAEGVEEEALPSDRAFRNFTDDGEYKILEERRLEQMPDLQPKSSVPGYPAGATEPIPEPALLTVLMKHGTARLRISERLSEEYDAASQRAERAESRILADLERAWEDGVNIVPPSGIEVSQGADPEANKESYPHYLGDYADATLFRAALTLPDADPSALMLASLYMQRRDRLARDRRLLRPNVMLRLVGMLITMMGHMRRGLQSGFFASAGAGGPDAAKPATGMGAAKGGATVPTAWHTPKAGAAPGAMGAAAATVMAYEDAPCVLCEAERRAAEAAAQPGPGPDVVAAGPAPTQGKTDSDGLCADSVAFGRDSARPATGPAGSPTSAGAKGGVGPAGSRLARVQPGSVQHQVLLSVADGFMAMVAGTPPEIAEAGMTSTFADQGVPAAKAAQYAKQMVSGELDRDGVLALLVEYALPPAS